jgi:hypothetical protein
MRGRGVFGAVLGAGQQGSSETLRRDEEATGPLACFLEVLILRDFKSLFPEVLILRGFKSLFLEVLILVGLKSRGISMIRSFEFFL